MNEELRGQVAVQVIDLAQIGRGVRKPGKALRQGLVVPAEIKRLVPVVRG